MRGERAATWAPCLRMAVALRVECRGDPECGQQVTRDFSYACYAGRYAAPKVQAVAAPESLSPCFLPHEPYRPPSDPAGLCRAMDVPPALETTCEDELRYVVAEICSAGAPALTGSGP